jgi:hypothetical protein
MTHIPPAEPQVPTWAELLKRITSHYVERATTDEIREIRSAISFYVQNTVSVVTDPIKPNSSTEQEEELS